MKKKALVEMLAEILVEAKWVVTLFDQANTASAIEGLGARGLALTRAVDDLRNAMTERGIDPYDVVGEDD